MLGNEKKVVLVTGGSRGIGKAVVEKFKNQRWLVATCATNLDHLLDNPADFKFKCDVSQVEEVKQGIQQVKEHLGQIDVLVNNAGLSLGGDTLAEPDDQWHRIIDVNLNGTFYMCKY